MSPSPSGWTTVLQALQSATLDELAARFPDENKELGMPMRQNQFALPDSSLELFQCVFQLEGAKGLGLLALDASLPKAAKLTGAQFWDSILKRARTEFTQRKVAPVTSENGPEVGTLKKVIWFPIKLDFGRCFIGLGVCV